MYFRSLRAGVALLVMICSSATALSAQGWTLDAVIKTALAQHPLIEAARARVGAARGERIAAGALANPIATVWLENARFPLSLVGSAPDRLNSELSLYVTLPLEPLVQHSPRIRRADEDVKAAEGSLTVARRRVAADAAHAFFRVALAEVFADEAEENWARLDDLASYMRARVDEGVTAEGELLRVQVERDRLATEVVFAASEMTRRMGELAPYVQTDQPLVLTDIRVFVPELPAAGPQSTLPALDVLVARARDQRPEVIAARARVSAAAAAAEFERTLTVRQLGATFGSKRIEGQNSMIAGLNVAVPLFNRNAGGIARATSERLAAEQELAWLERTITAEVQTAYEVALALTRQLGTLQETLVTRAATIDRLTLGAYREGGATLLQVLDATRLHADARLTYSRMVLAQRESLFDLTLAGGADLIDAGGDLR